MDENSGCVSVGKERALVLWVWDTLQRQVWGFKGSVGLCSPFKPWPRERDGGAKEKAQTPCWGPAVPHQGGGRWEMQGWLLLQAEDAILPPEHTLVALLSEQPPPAPCTKRQQSVPRGLDANAECWDLRAAGEGVRMRGRQQDPRQSKRRNYAAPPANKLSHLRNPCTPSRLAF